MATQTSVFTFTGKFGDVIGYRRNGTHFFRSMPQTVQQTDATKRAAHNFGVASKKGRLIRNAFAAELDIHCDGSAINRLNGTLIKAGRNNHAGIAGFQFNKHTGVDRFFPVTPTFTKDGKLQIPAQELPQFKGINALEVKVIATRINFTERRVTGTDADVIRIDLQHPFEGAELQVEVPGKGVLIVALQVKGLCGDYTSGNRKHQAADVIAVMEPGKEKVFHKALSPSEEALKRRIEECLEPVVHERTAAVIQRE